MDPSQLASWPPAPGGHRPPPPQSYPPPPTRKAKGGLITAAIAGAAAIALTAGGIGGLIGNRITAGPAATASPQPAPPPPAPTAEQVHAATVDLCTRYVAANRALPSPQNNGFDVIPSYNYMAEALRENPSADSAIRDAVTESMRQTRDQAAHFSHEPAAGAIQPPITWSPTEATAAAQKVWDLCSAYRR